MTDWVESSIRASLATESVFETYRESAPPGFQAAAANLAFWSAVAAFLCGALAYFRLPNTPEPLIVLLGWAAGTLVLTVGGLALAGAIHALSGLVGGEAPFERSLLLVSLLSPLIVLHLSAFWAPVPFLWLATTGYAVWVFSRGLVRMHGVPEASSLLVMGILGLALAGAQAAAVKEGARLRDALQGVPAPAAAPVVLSVPDAAPRSTRAGGSAVSVAVDVSAAPDSVGMVQGGSLPGQEAAFAPEQGSSGDPNNRLKSLDLWSQKLSQDSDIARSMPPEQRAQLGRVKEAVDSVRLQAQQGGRVPSKEEMLMRVIQQLGAAGQQGGQVEEPPKGKPAKAKKKARPRKKSSEEPDLDTDLGLEATP
jgi:hypothetical protein